MTIKGFPEEFIRIERMRLYKEPSVQMLLSALVENEVSELVPTLYSDNTPHYTVVENALGEPTEQVNSLIEKLFHAGILERRFFERLLCCPTCKSSTSIVTRHSCPNCNSQNFTVRRTIKHMACREVISDLDQTDRPLCPKCRIPVEPDDAVTIGTSITCHDCKTESVDLLQTFECTKCKEEFTFTHADFVIVHAYSLCEKLRKEIQKNLLIPRISSFFASHGFSVEIPGTSVGKMGTLHTFSLAASKGNMRMFFEILQDEEDIGLSQILPTYIKIKDCNLEKDAAWIIAVPGLTTEAEKFLSTQEIRYANEDDLPTIVKETIERLNASTSIRRARRRISG